MRVSKVGPEYNSFKMWGSFGVVCLIFATSANAANVLETMEAKSVEQFIQQITNTPTATQFIQNEITVFAPSNDAMNKFDGPKDENFVRNHMVNIAVRIGGNGEPSRITQVPSMLPGSPPLYVTKDGGNFYVNGAELIMRNLKAKSDTTDKVQYLHIIDRVLEPLTPQDGDSQTLVGLTAGKLLRESDKFRIGESTIAEFTSQVRSKNKLDLFEAPGQHTFFVPVDSAFQNLSKELVDENVIRGHVVPNTLLFTRPILKSEAKTATYTEGSSIKVTASIQNTPSGPQVKSNTVQGNRHHTREHVLANVVRANIPVSNGIVHLIDKPLVIIANPLSEYLALEEQQGGRLSRFARYVRKFAPDLQTLIESTKTGTVFAPTDDAFGSMTEAEMEEILQDPEEAQKILGMHFVDQRIASDDIRITQPQNDEGMFGVNVPFPETSKDKVWFYYDPDSHSLMVDAVGVSAKVTEADVGASNGVIHVINRVFGLPSQSVFDKLATDPMLSSSFSLGNQDHFNDRLSNPEESFTFFVPTNKAWELIQKQSASTHKILFMGAFSYQSQSLLERHFKIGEALSVEEMVERTEDNGEGVEMLRGTSPLSVGMDTDEDGEYAYVEWENIRAKIIRPNLKCSNGYVHILDRVLMKPRDVVLSGAPDPYQSTSLWPITALTSVLSWSVSRALL
ncbi:hypothetical protein TCAL_07251 [Tigriopus californicus]|uniref:FAS1 domain-containing protein n=1 Tax=Tigriopus californicus TaxID=6832 RepID=A0A553NSX7_TIGCA|nr:fasciclin-1-like [Tigriopus californicus]TRY68541.1 hypothetical protein TCAL_07251 [Tigriopus californicus]